MSNLKVAIIGPESTGKTTLSNQLAVHYKAPAVPEYARTYIENLERVYGYEDLLSIAEIQKEETDQVSVSCNGLMFSDTSLITIAIWSHDKFDRCDPWIINEMQKERFDLYLLCDIDIAWVFDIQREDPDRRNEIFRLHELFLKKYGFVYEVVSGQGQERISNAIHLIEKHLKS